MGRARWASREAVMAGVEPGAGGGEVVASAGAVCGAREEGLGMKRGPQCVATEQHEAAHGGVGSPAASDTGENGDGQQSSAAAGGARLSKRIAGD